MNLAYAETFATAPPARSAVAVSGLPLGALVEIEAWAFGGS
jgi:enamine deaminase RidA (YjgF/YER057c/UK114 family)